jgi:hypothetical protein
MTSNRNTVRDIDARSFRQNASDPGSRREGDGSPTAHDSPLDALIERVNQGDHDEHLRWILRDIETLRGRPADRRPETLTSVDAALQAIRTRLLTVERRR